jgi:hypothetical protein
MARSPVTFDPLVILNTATDSNLLINRVGFGNLVDFIVYAPATLPETVTVYVSNVRATAWSQMRQLIVNGSAVTVAAGKAVQVPVAAFKTLGLKSASAVGADRTFPVVGQVDQ